MDPVETQAPVTVPTEVLATLVEIVQEINASLELGDVLARTAALIKRLVDYEIFAVLLLDAHSEHLTFRLAIGHRQEVVEGWRVALGQGITGRAAASGRAIRVGDVSREQNYINAVESVRSELAVPLMIKGKCIGVLDIQSRELDYFTRDQQNILTLLAGRLAIAIENARLFEHARDQAETLILLHEVARDAGSILEVEALLRRAAELAKRVIDYQIFSILLYDERDHTFRHRITVKFGERVQEKFAVPASEGIVGAAALSRQPVLVPDVSADPRYLALNAETRSELAIPMVFKGRVIGVMDLESPQLNYFTEDHVQTLSILAAHLAVSLENARLYEQVTRDEARMERELQAARRIQGGLLRKVPAEDYGLDIAARYDSAREVGGDLYDFIRYGPQQLGVALGDVSGKGTAAALYCAVGIGILRSLAQQKLQPAAMLCEMNRLLGERRIEDRFMTLCFATWQRGRQRLRIANAGQSQPLLWKSGRCEKLNLVGFPLGMMDEVSYDEWSTTLDPGDMLVFYSDGITEASSRRGEFYGTHRLLDLIAANAALAAAEFADLVLADVERFADGAPAGDDRTLVILKVK
ncbi:MAG: SpoIIE family protein phosphatase [Acidobacteria bacterium]|nr:SpoIIE family protein phosphatase [Acidobacteriota bacterium]MBI3663291.1 SpoIIE family protein phosphatase [Acidobacteriota bacterium]